MSSGELMIIFLVALIVFGPDKLPMLAEHLGKLFRQFNHLKQKAAQFWQQQLHEQQLLENIRKAKEADEVYNNSQEEEK